MPTLKNINFNDLEFLRQNGTLNFSLKVTPLEASLNKSSMIHPFWSGFFCLIHFGADWLK
jgi:hypothetical protein